MAKIITVYINNPRSSDVENGKLTPVDMSYIRWLKISESLARIGHDVDIAVPDRIHCNENPVREFHDTKITEVPLSKVNWYNYDVIKTLFNHGVETLNKFNGINHPFIISKLGSVVAPEDREGIYFYGDIREMLYESQVLINRHSRYVTVLSDNARNLWMECFGNDNDILIVPGGVDSIIPEPKKNPYPDDGLRRCIFAGNVYTRDSQPEANRVLIKKLNYLGKLLSKSGIKVYLLGHGDISNLEPEYVNYLGMADYDMSWDYFYYADIGLVVSAGKFMHNNESSKIYHYLRAGLPVVSESGFPNDYVVKDSKLGFVVESENMMLMSEKIEEAAYKKWDSEYAVNYILINHTWDQRVEIYNKIISDYN